MKVFYISFLIGDPPEVREGEIKWSNGYYHGPHGRLHGLVEMDEKGLGRWIISSRIYYSTKEIAQTVLLHNYPNWIVCSPIHLEAYRLILLFGGWDSGHGETEKTMARKYGIPSHILWQLCRGSKEIDNKVVNHFLIEFLKQNPIKITHPWFIKESKHRTPLGALRTLRKFQSKNIEPTLEPVKQ